MTPGYWEQFSCLCLFALVLVITCTACKSPSQYISPRIEGRVVDETTRQPIPDVYVRRSSDVPRSRYPVKGAQALSTPAPIATGEDGGFVVGSERALVFLPHSSWASVTLYFNHPGYERLTRTYSQLDSTNAPGGEPLVLAGEIPLRPHNN
jgi:hypothetical protein